VWAEKAANSWRFRSVELQPSTGHSSAAVDLGQAPEDLELLFLRSLTGRGAILAYTYADNNGGHGLSVMTLDDQGRLSSGPITLGASSEALLWIDIVPTSKGPLVFWASSRGDRADVRAAALNTEGALRVAAHDVLSDLRAWQVAATPQGAALAAVRAVSNQGSGPISLSFLDETGTVIDKTLSITQSETAELDLDVSYVGKNCVIAWTDRTQGDARLYAAAVSTSGQVITAAYPVTPPLGDQSLVKLVASVGPSKGYLVWENVLAPSSVRRLQVAPIDSSAKLGSERLSFSYQSSSDRSTDIVATSRGLAYVTQVPTAVIRELAAPAKLDLSFDGEEGSTVPTFVSVSEKMEVTGVAPLMLASKPTLPSLVWGLHCRAADCFALAAISGDPQAAVLGVALSHNQTAGRSLLANGGAKQPANPVNSSAFDAKLRAWLVDERTTGTRPKLAAVRVVGETEPLADLAVTNSLDVPLVSTLTYFNPDAPLVRLTAPAEDGRREPLQARIDLRGPLGEAPSSLGYVSLRARSAGGLAWAVSPDGKDRLLAWSALDGREPQVFVTQFDEGGKKRAQREITHRKGNITDIAATATPGGFYIGWIDDRVATAQAYLTRLSRTLERQGPEQAVTTAAGGKSGLKLHTVGNSLWAVWSDSRESPTSRADIFLRRFSINDGRALGDDQRLFETPGHSHSPLIASSDSGVLIAWMESEPGGDRADGTASVKIARLSAEGRPSGTRSVQISQGVPTAFGFGCAKKECHLVVAVDLGGTGQIEAASLEPSADSPIHTVPLIRSLGPADESVSPVVVANDVYWVDRSTTKHVRVMRAAVEWQ
jgi:hypothetical protein